VPIAAFIPVEYGLKMPPIYCDSPAVKFMKFILGTSAKNVKRASRFFEKIVCGKILGGESLAKAREALRGDNEKSKRTAKNTKDAKRTVHVFLSRVFAPFAVK
jgi:hypothetical protein